MFRLNANKIKYFSLKFIHFLLIYRFYYVVCDSSALSRKLTLILDGKNLSQISKEDFLSFFPFKNIVVDLSSNAIYNKDILKHLDSFRESVEQIEFKFCRFENNSELTNILKNLKKLKEINFKSCLIKKFNNINEIDHITENLDSISFEDCDEYIYTCFKNHRSIRKITVTSFKKGWNGFPHEAFNDLAKSLPELKHLKFAGEGTASYFEQSSFPFNIEILEAYTLTHHWYVGIRGARNKVLESQKSNLKVLRIEELPSDFDGGRILKYIMNEMNLNEFYYGGIPLILNGNKQNVKSFTANETQILAAFEMFSEFPGKFKNFNLKFLNL